MSDPSFPCPHQYFVVNILILVILTCMQCYLMANDAACLSCACCQLCILFGEMFLYVFCMFSNWVVCPVPVEY